MGEIEQPGEMLEVFIQLQPDNIHSIEPFIEAIEEKHGHVLLSYSHYVIIAKLTQTAVEDLRRLPGIQSIDTEKIRGERLQAAQGTLQFAIAAWNDHFQKNRPASPRADFGMSWDAPGRLPPDPPSHLQEILRRREQELGQAEDNLDIP